MVRKIGPSLYEIPYLTHVEGLQTRVDGDCVGLSMTGRWHNSQDSQHTVPSNHIHISDVWEDEDIPAEAALHAEERDSKPPILLSAQDPPHKVHHFPGTPAPFDVHFHQDNVIHLINRKMNY